MNNSIEIMDDFLDQEDFQALKSLKLDSIASNEIKSLHNTIDKNNKIVESCLDENLILKLHKKYHNRVFDILKKLSPEKAEIYDYSDFEVTQTGKDYTFPIHDDTPEKLLSGIVYLYPEKNIGTYFHSSKSGNDKKEVKWKENRGVFFTRKEKKTWHSFSGNEISKRVVMIYNLKTLKVREVYKIEKKNYYLGLLRWKINPYIYRFFKITV